MRNVRRILVAIKDPNARTLPAVAKAFQLARAFGAQVELFHAIATPVYVEPETLGVGGLRDVERTQRAQYRHQLEALAAPARKQGIKVTTDAECDYPPHEAIVRRANRMKADLIIAECHGGRHRVPWLLHLTDWDLLRDSPAPVLIVKSKQPYRHPVMLAAVDPTHAFAKPTKLDDEILRAGTTVQRALRGSLHAVHAYNPIPADATNAELVRADAPERMEARARASARVKFYRALGKVSIPRARRHLVGRHPIDAIPELAGKIGCAIVVMGAVSRSGLKRVFIGNTAERVLDAITCDVLVVKPRQFVSRVARAKRGVRIIVPQMPLPY